MKHKYIVLFIIPVLLLSNMEINAEKDCSLVLKELEKKRLDIVTNTQPSYVGAGMALAMHNIERDCYDAKPQIEEYIEILSKLERTPHSHDVDINTLKRINIGMRISLDVLENNVIKF